MDEVLIQIFPNMTLWKLHSLKEYLIFGLLLVGGALLFWFWIQRLKKARTPEGARKRVLKAIKSASHGHFNPISPAGITTGRNPLWILLPHDMLLLEVVYRGYRIQGSEWAEQWSLNDNSESRKVPNPLMALEKDRETVEKQLQTAKFPPLALHTFVIGADNYAETTFKLDEGARAHALTLPELKQWIKKRNLQPLSEKKQKELLSLLKF